MKKEFIEFIENLINHDEKYAKSIMTEDIQKYFELLKNEESNKPEITDNGKIVLKYMQDNNVTIGKAKDIAEGLGVPTRRVAGSLRKLVTDGFAEKVATNPVIYGITEKGKNYKID